MAVGLLVALTVAGFADATQSLIRKDPAMASGIAPIEARRHQYDRVPSPAPAALLSQDTTAAPSNTADCSGAESDFTDRAFRLGSPGTNVCQSDMNTAGAGGYDCRIMRKILCEFAAQKMGATAGDNTTSPGSPFVLVFDDNDRPSQDFPQGCFVKDSSDTHLFWNSWGTPPSTQTASSTPICHRYKYFLGTPNTTNGNCDGSAANGASGTAADYVQVLDEDECRAASHVLGLSITEGAYTYGVASPSPSAAGWVEPQGATNYNQWPKGCFKNYVDEGVVFNVPQDAAGVAQSDTTLQVDPTGLSQTGGVQIGITGIPICKLNPAHYPY